MTQPANERETIANYAELYDHRKLWQQMTWFGHDVAKTPSDMWLYQEIVARVKPALIVEFGTSIGGTALYLSHLLDILGGNRRVLTIDIEDRGTIPEHPRLTFRKSHTRDEETIAWVHEVASEQSSHGGVLLIEDSFHDNNHVLAELEEYYRLVTRGSYFIVEDMGSVSSDRPGCPCRAVAEFLNRHREFELDLSCHKYLHTVAWNGFLRRK